MKKSLVIGTVAVMLFLSFSLPLLNVSAAEYVNEAECKSVILMDAATGTVLYEKNADEALPPASVTKIMTLLLIMEALSEGKIALNDSVTASERAAEMGGSQIFMKVGENFTCEELIKSIVIASANDATVAMAEHIAGSEAAFVDLMNEKAAALGMNNTHFENTNGLDDTAEHHLTSARDIAIMSRALLAHKKILDYTSIWMDSIRNGEFVLTNTNRLVRYYQGATGLKTGSTAKAGFCISATAMRDGMHLIAVVMGAPTRDTRNEIAKGLLDYGFANYSVFNYEGGEMGTVTVTGGNKDSATVIGTPLTLLIEKGKRNSVTSEIEMLDSVAAPKSEGDEVGVIRFYLDGKEIGSAPLCIGEGIGKITFWEYFIKLLHHTLTLGAA